MAEYEGVMIPIQVFDSKSVQVFAKAVPLRSSGTRLDRDFDSGAYLVRAILPSGEMLADTVALQSGSDGTAWLSPKHQSPREELSWAYYLQKPPDFQNLLMSGGLQHRIPPTPDNMKYWAHDHKNGWRVISPSDGNIFARIEYDTLGNLETTQLIQISFKQPGGGWKYFPAQIWLEVPGITGSVFAALPIASKLRVLIAPDHSTRSLPWRVQSSCGDSSMDALLSFLASGDFESARAIGQNLAEVGEDLLYGKLQNPMAAAVGGYFLLQAGELERLHEWTANLANWFEWLPDGPIIRACHLMTKPETNAVAVRRLLLESIKRGLPYYTIGLRLLQNGLKLLLQRSKRHFVIAAALKTINSHFEAADASSTVTTFTGETPNRPAILQKLSHPSVERNSRRLYGEIES
jgi:hypothetical protein